MPASARRADGLVALVNAAHASGSIPEPRWAAGERVGDSGIHHRSGIRCGPRPGAHPDRRGGPIHRVRRAGHPDPARHGGHCPDTVAEADLLAAAAGTGPRTDPGDPGFGGAGRDNGPAEGRVGARRRPGTWADGRRRGRGPGLPRGWRHAHGGGADRGPGQHPAGDPISLAVGRTARTATPAQRRALAVRDRGCIIPGCAIPAEACQTHHVQDWAAGGKTNLPNMALLCWAHHRQVDLGVWTIVPTNTADQVPRPEPGAPPGTPWPGNNGAPWTITRTPRTRWRL